MALTMAHNSLRPDIGGTNDAMEISSDAGRNDGNDLSDEEIDIDLDDAEEHGPNGEDDFMQDDGSVGGDQLFNQQAPETLTDDIMFDEIGGDAAQEEYEELEDASQHGDDGYLQVFDADDGEVQHPEIPDDEANDETLIDHEPIPEPENRDVVEQVDDDHAVDLGDKTTEINTTSSMQDHLDDLSGAETQQGNDLFSVEKQVRVEDDDDRPEPSVPGLNHSDKTAHSDAEYDIDHEAQPTMQNTSQNRRSSPTESGHQDAQETERASAHVPSKRRPSHEEHLYKQPFAGHPVIVWSGQTEAYLFPQAHDDTLPFMLTDPSLAHAPFKDLLVACRVWLGDNVDESVELEMDAWELGLRITEDSPYAASAALTDILELYVKLCQNDGQASLEPLSVNLTSRHRYFERFQTLRNAIAEGKGLSEMGLDPDYEEDRNDDYDDSGILQDETVASAMEQYHASDRSLQQLFDAATPRGDHPDPKSIVEAQPEDQTIVDQIALAHAEPQLRGKSQEPLSKAQSLGTDAHESAPAAQDQLEEQIVATEAVEIEHNANMDPQSPDYLENAATNPHNGSLDLGRPYEQEDLLEPTDDGEIGPLETDDEIDHNDETDILLEASDEHLDNEGQEFNEDGASVPYEQAEHDSAEDANAVGEAAVEPEFKGEPEYEYDLDDREQIDPTTDAPHDPLDTESLIAEQILPESTTLEDGGPVNDMPHSSHRENGFEQNIDYSEPIESSSREVKLTKSVAHKRSRQELEEEEPNPDIGNDLKKRRQS